MYRPIEYKVSNTTSHLFGSQTNYFSHGYSQELFSFIWALNFLHNQSGFLRRFLAIQFVFAHPCCMFVGVNCLAKNADPVRHVWIFFIGLTTFLCEIYFPNTTFWFTRHFKWWPFEKCLSSWLILGLDTAEPNSFESIPDPKSDIY